LSNKPHDIVIYNLLGQAVYQTRMNGSTVHLEAPWSTGFYFVQVDNQPTLKLQLLR
ncbi:T9SS type A sorting domain-containing protein, partial [bacterium]|nr:T9SS type A sorting domain-containing protein [bacterium]